MTAIGRFTFEGETGQGELDFKEGETLTLLKWYLAIGAYFFFILDELTPATLVESSPIDLPLLILDFMDVPLLALSVWALYTMEQQVSLTPAPMLY